jgi:hypothetical protein
VEVEVEVGGRRIGGMEELGERGRAEAEAAPKFDGSFLPVTCKDIARTVTESEAL